METINVLERPSKPLSAGLSACSLEVWREHSVDPSSVDLSSELRLSLPIDTAHPRSSAIRSDVPNYAPTVIRAQGPSVISMPPESVSAGAAGVDKQQQGTGVSTFAQVTRRGEARGVPPRGRPDC